jgi:hypothetical protein
MASTTIKVSTETRDRLRDRSGDGTLEDAIVEALDIAEANDFWRQAEEWRSWRDNLQGDELAAVVAQERELDAFVTRLR